MRNFKKSTVAAALMAALAMGVSSQASAFVYAASGLTITDFTLTNTAGTVTVNRFDFTLTNTAALNGAAVISTNTCGGTPTANNCNPGPPVLDAPAVNAPGSTVVRTNNLSAGGEFLFFGPAPGDYANSDSVINTAQLVTGSPTSTNNIAEANLATGTSASGSSQINSITGFTLTFTVGGPTSDLILNFNADPDLRAAIFGESGTFSAQANMNASFSLQSTGATPATLVSWSPQGTAANDCFAVGVACAENADSADLNINVGTTTNGTETLSSWDPNVYTPGNFGITISGLAAGTYSLTLNEVKSVSLARTVSEPGMLALMGIGLMGFVAAGRRKNKNA